MNTKAKVKKGRGIYALPFLAALPMILAMAFAVLRFWPSLRKLISIMMKLVVRA